ncbi:MAG: DUF2203 family protein [Planctomycetota bacterium]|jgi:hypothetical protein
MRSHTFTVEEANQTIPLVARIVGDIVRDYAALSDHAAEYKSLRSREERAEETQDRLNELKQAMSRLSDQIDGFVTELAEIGCEMKDLAEGVVDFPAILDDRRVHLCWCLGEDRVDHWHEVTEGFSGRRPLPVRV